MPTKLVLALRALGVSLGLLTLPAAAGSVGAAPVGSHAFAGFTDSRPIGDFNGDGFDDLADRTGRVVFGAADLSRAATTTFDIPVANRGGVQRLGDIDGDGYDDIALAVVPQGGGSGTSVTILYGAPGTTGIPVVPGPRVGIVRTGPLTSGTGAQGVGDFNGDGFDDLVVYRRNKSELDPSMIGGYTVVLGGPRITTLDANIAGPRTVLLSGTTSCSVVTIFFIPISYRCRENSVGLQPAGDVNGDGKGDLVYGTTGPSIRGLIFGRAGSGTTMKLTSPAAPAATFDGSQQTALPVAVGDLDGDGKDDLMRGCGSETTNVLLYRGRTVPAGTQFSVASPTWTLTGSSFCGETIPVGDTDGDGADDLVWQQVNRRAVAEGIGSVDVSLVTGIRTLATGASAPLAASTRVEGIARLAAQLGGITPPVQSRAGDLDGDGRADLLLADEQGRAVIATHGADRLAPEIATRIDQPTLERIPAAKVSPSGFTPGPGAAAISLVLDGPAVVRFAVKRAGAAVGAFERTVPALASEVPWDGKLSGTPLADGNYTLEITPRDAAGNAGITRSVPFTVGGGPPLGAATVALSAKLLAPDGTQFPGELGWSAQCPGLASATHESGATVTLGGESRFAGQHCILSVGAIEVQGLEGCSWQTRVAVNGGAAVDPATLGGTVDFELRAGQNTAAATVQCVGGRVITAGRPERFDVSTRWLKYGSARQAGQAVTLTTAGASQAGAVVWPDAFDPSGLTFSFYVTMSGGNSTAEGIALAFLPATQPLPPATAPFGPPGGALGLGSLPFTAITLDTFKQPTDPAAAFVGLATGSSGDALTYLQSADPGIRLRTANLWISLTYKGGALTVLVNGKQRLQRTIALPPSVRLAFSAATNATGWQQHVVHGFNVVPAP